MRRPRPRSGGQRGKGGKRPRRWHHADTPEARHRAELARSIEPVFAAAEAERRRPSKRELRRERARDREALVAALAHVAPTVLAPWPSW